MSVLRNRKSPLPPQRQDTKAASGDDIIKGLSASSKLSAETGHPGMGIKPCIATLAETALEKGGFPNRNAAAVAIAAELKRIGIEYDQACRQLVDWNSHNLPPLKPSELRRAIDNGYSRDYNYSCNHPVLTAFCIGEKECPFIQRVKGKPNRHNDLKFLDYGWQRILSSSQVLIYSVALPYLEKTRRIVRGGLICANHKQIAQACGIANRRIGQHLSTLAAVDLIQYQVGLSMKWMGKASEIRRIFPIPHPTRERTEIIKQMKTQKGT